MACSVPLSSPLPSSSSPDGTHVHTSNNSVNAPPKLKKIIIIGGGAAGLASLQAVLATTEHQRGEWEVILFEEREDIGGVWYVYLLRSLSG
jgi:cation diffusion facilitator CzcD-associated flavoprotein CzcO